MPDSDLSPSEAANRHPLISAVTSEAPDPQPAGAPPTGSPNPTRRVTSEALDPQPAGDAAAYDSVLIVSFGGPEGPSDVMPFLRNVTAGRNIPDERLATVAQQYLHFGGVSPINEQCRRLRNALKQQLSDAGHDLRVYWGNRNWHPYLADIVAEMAADGCRRALAVVTSAYSSYSGCRQYLEDIAAARAKVGASAPVIDKVRAYHDHPGFVLPFADSVAAARARLPADKREDARLIFTAHSIPLTMAVGCDYERQLRETAQLVANAASFSDWRLAWQSRSGPPSIPWLEPDICDVLTELAACPNPPNAVVLAPIGFVTDHMEIMWDLDQQASAAANNAGITLERAITPGTTPDNRFIEMWQELIEERLNPQAERLSLGPSPIKPDTCPPNCCPPRNQH